MGRKSGGSRGKSGRREGARPQDAGLGIGRLRLGIGTLVTIGGIALVAVVIAVTAVQLSRGAGAASDFEFTLYQGEEVLGASPVNFADVLDDGKPVVLKFWGGDCPPCRAEMPGFQRVYESHRD